MPEIVWLNTIKQKEKRYLIDMKKKVILISVISVIIAFLATSCFDEKFTDNPSHVLSFSTDIVKFDTIFTDKGTATLSFRVYNRNNRAVRIESVRLADAEHSGFHINVDGEKGPEAGDRRQVLFQPGDQVHIALGLVGRGEGVHVLEAGQRERLHERRGVELHGART